MKIALLSESRADKTALKILVDGILGIQTEDVAPQLEERSWPGLRSVLGATIKAVHFKTEAVGLVVLVDSNHSPFEADQTNSRANELQREIDKILADLKPVNGRCLKVALGVACPAIEAWLLAHRQGNVNEAEWRRGLQERRDSYTKAKLKAWLYDGDIRPDLGTETAKMVEAARELSSQISLLDDKFPIGFGKLAAEVRSWKRVGPA